MQDLTYIRIFLVISIDSNKGIHDVYKMDVDLSKTLNQVKETQPAQNLLQIQFKPVRRPITLGDYLIIIITSMARTDEALESQSRTKRKKMQWNYDCQPLMSYSNLGHFGLQGGFYYRHVGCKIDPQLQTCIRSFHARGRAFQIAL